MNTSNVYEFVNNYECGEELRPLCTETIKFACLKDHDLSGASFYSCLFEGVLFENINFDKATFSHCLFVGCTFTTVTFVDAFITCSFFTNCTFVNSDLDKAKGHDFGYCNISIQNKSVSECSCIRMACPEEGSFIAWKKVAYVADADGLPVSFDQLGIRAPSIRLSPIFKRHIRYALVKLQIPAEATRSSAGSRKCRCEYADVLDIEDIESGKKMSFVRNCIYPKVYIKGKRVHPDSFDTNRWNECSNGIHFFMSKQDALEYVIC